jgi:NAD(P)-dependent dehydrogenase (short-subunit alcohol dehydrogenase family)
MAIERSDRICLVTGATNGIGEATARELARLGMTVVVAGRDKARAQQVVREIRTATGNRNVDCLIADLSVMAGVRRLAAAFRARHDRLHVLVNNAGAIFTERRETPDGLEMTFALNHLSYFLLTHLLLDLIVAAGTARKHARIVNVSSGAHHSAALDFTDLQSKRRYNGLAVYSRSKLMNLMFTYALARQLKSQGAPLDVNALHPGLVGSGFGHNNGLLTRFAMTVMKPFARTPEQGAQTSIYLASSPEVEGVTGKYFVDERVQASSQTARDRDAQARLWAISAELAGLVESAYAG